MTYPYTATIEGEPRKITGMDADGKYLLAGDEILWIKPLKKGETFRALTLEKVSKLTFTGGEWMIDGENVKSRCVDATIKNRKKSGKARTEAHTIFHLHEKLGGLSDEDGTKIKGVAWFGEHYAEVEGETAESCAVRQDFLDSIHGPGKFEVKPPLPPAKSFRPVLLTDYQVSPRHMGDGQQAKSTPRYFTIKSAAKYAKRSERTIRNWIKDGWLIVEKNKSGKKIRIEKAALDKSINKQ